MLNIQPIKSMLASIMLFLPMQHSAASESTHDSPSQKAMVLFEQAHADLITRYPIALTFRGYQQHKDKWNDLSLDKVAEDRRVAQKQLRTVKEKVKFDELNQETKVYYQLFIRGREQFIAKQQFYLMSFPIVRNFGLLDLMPFFLENYHQINNKKDAEDYLSRLNAIPALFSQVGDLMEQQRLKNIFAPKIVYQTHIENINNLMTGYPIDQSTKENHYYRDFMAKIDVLPIATNEKQSLLKQLRESLRQNVKPAYTQMISSLAEMSASSRNNGGLSNIDGGEQYYQQVLTGLFDDNITANQLHEHGLQYLEEQHQKLMSQAKKMGFEGATIKDVFKWLKSEPAFYYPNNDEGRKQYLEKLNTYHTKAQSLLPRLFSSYPEKKLHIRRIPSHQEANATIAYYTALPNGEGIYSINLHDMQDAPKYLAESLLVHEGVPGHHLEVSYGTFLELPTFHKESAFFTLDSRGFNEGWATFAEILAQEQGMMQSDVSKLGRILWDTKAAGQMVADTGLHIKHWTINQAIQFLTDSTSFTYNQAVSQIKRYTVLPGQALTYMHGTNKFIKLKQKAKQKLKHRFDLRQFNDAILQYSAIPFSLLESNIEQWIANQR